MLGKVEHRSLLVDKTGHSVDPPSTVGLLIVLGVALVLLIGGVVIDRRPLRRGVVPHRPRSRSSARFAGGGVSRAYGFTERKLTDDDAIKLWHRTHDGAIALVQGLKVVYLSAADARRIGQVAEPGGWTPPN